MLEYDRIDVSKGTDVNKTILSKECDICHYWYFKDIGFNPIQDGGAKKVLPTSFSHVTSTNVGIGP